LLFILQKRMASSGESLQAGWGGLAADALASEFCTCGQSLSLIPISAGSAAVFDETSILTHSKQAAVMA
jgi:hypothetical protein